MIRILLLTSIFFLDFYHDHTPSFAQKHSHELIQLDTQQITPEIISQPITKYNTAQLFHQGYLTSKLNNNNNSIIPLSGVDNMDHTRRRFDAVKNWPPKYNNINFIIGAVHWTITNLQDIKHTVKIKTHFFIKKKNHKFVSNNNSKITLGSPRNAHNNNSSSYETLIQSSATN